MYLFECRKRSACLTIKRVRACLSEGVYVRDFLHK